MRLRLAPDHHGRALPAAWDVVAAFLLIVAPSFLWRERPFWLLSAAELPHLLVFVLAYLLLVLLLRQAGSRPQGIGLIPAALMAAAAYGAAYLLLLLRPDLPHSRVVLAVSGALGIGFAFLPFLLRGGRALLLMVAAAGGLLVVALGVARTIEPPAPRILASGLHSVVVEEFGDLVRRPLATDGGAVARLGPGFLLVTGDGSFYRLSWKQSGTALVSERMMLAAPLDRAGFLEDHAGRGTPPKLRVTDLLLDTLARPARVYLAHQYWHRAGRCFTLRVSTAPLELSPGDSGESGAGWRTLYDTRPCLARSGAFSDIETGGRLGRAPNGDVLLTVGDHGFDGRAGTALAQDSSGDYGKVLRLGENGSRTLLSLGHRNPQGLAVDASGRIWETEHGPQGGDELNLIVAGGNYGWPLATYGTEYGLETWPLAPDARDHGAFREPVHAFFPSVATSNLIVLGGRQFPRWAGDLLIASLSGNSLFRVRIRDDRVAYVEPIRVGHRIRDLEEGSDGRLVLWTDEGDLLTLARAPVAPTGEAVFARCRACHEPGPGGAAALAPDLTGVFGRTIASVSGFPYSEALRGRDGRWTRERLDAFLEDPERFAPGTRMQAGRVPDSAERQAIIEYLERMR